jgi:hypothetical protein
MIFGIRKTYLGILTGTVLIALTTGVFKFTDAFALRDVSITPEKYDYLAAELNLPSGENVFNIPPHDAMKGILAEDKIIKVEWNYALPGDIRIEVNDCEPLALAMSVDGRSILAINNTGYIFPYEMQSDMYDAPVITGIDKYKLYKRIANHRIILILNQLNMLKESDEEYYRLLSSIGISDQQYISVFIEGLAMELVVYPGSLCRSILALKEFLHEYNPDLNRAKKLDFRSENIIVTVN